MKPLIWSWTHEAEYRQWIRRVVADPNSMAFQIPMGIGETPLDVFGTQELRKAWRALPNEYSRPKWLTSMRRAVAERTLRAEWVDREDGMLLDHFVVESDNYGFRLSTTVVMGWSSDGIALGVASEILDSDALVDRFLLGLALAEIEGPQCHE